LLGVSVRRVQAVARSGAVVTRRGPGRCWLFDRQSLVAWSVLVSPDRRPHVELLGTVGVPDEVLANRLGVKLSTVRRWHRRGVPNLYVAQLRSLATPGKRR
jgi:phage terminase Nu1 subunit (DNA packaging protein)